MLANVVNSKLKAQHYLIIWLVFLAATIASSVTSGYIAVSAGVIGTSLAIYMIFSHEIKKAIKRIK